jgi:hypothetical protein
MTFGLFACSSYNTVQKNSQVIISYPVLGGTSGAYMYIKNLRLTMVLNMNSSVADPDPSIIKKK